LKKKSIWTPAWRALCARLVEMREAAGFTQRQLARRLARAPSIVAKIEQGERRVDVLEFCSICWACGAAPEREFVALVRAFKAAQRTKGTGRR